MSHQLGRALWSCW